MPLPRGATHDHAPVLERDVVLVPSQPVIQPGEIDGTPLPAPRAWYAVDDVEILRPRQRPLLVPVCGLVLGHQPLPPDLPGPGIRARDPQVRECPAPQG